MNVLRLNVAQFNQRMSGGSYIVAYSAEVILVEGSEEIEIQVISTRPEDANSALVQRAVQDTRDGFREVLESKMLGAVVKLSDLVLHDVDYKSRRQREISAEHLKRALESTSA